MVGCADASRTGQFPSPPSVCIIPQIGEKEICLAIESGKNRNGRAFADDGNAGLVGFFGPAGEHRAHWRGIGIACIIGTGENVSHGLLEAGVSLQ